MLLKSPVLALDPGSRNDHQPAPVTQIMVPRRRQGWLDGVEAMAMITGLLVLLVLLVLVLTGSFAVGFVCLIIC